MTRFFALYGRSAPNSAVPPEEALEAQLESCRMQVNAAGDLVLTEYTDCGYFGTNRNRPGLNSLLTDVHGPHAFDAVMVLDETRLSRSPHHLNSILQGLASAQVLVVCVNGAVTL